MMLRTDAAPVPRPESDRPDVRATRFLGVPLLGLLAVEFLVGMTLNLFVALPGGAPLAILGSSPVLIAHMVIAVMLLGIAGRAIVLGRRVGDRWVLGAGAIALLSGVVATLAGFAFTFGTPSDAASFAMAGGFTGMLVAGILLLFPRPEGAGPIARASPTVTAL